MICTRRAPLKRNVRALLQAGAARHDLLVQFLIHDLDRAVDLGAGRAELMRDQLHQQVDALDEGRAARRPRAPPMTA